MSIPENALRELSDPIYAREDKASVGAAFRELGVEPQQGFREFYERFGEPFGSEQTGFELLDMVDQEVNIPALTRVGREVHGFPNECLVLTDLLGGGVLVYNTQNDCVYNVDFEGSHEELIRGTLQPEWDSFAEFLEEYFAPADEEDDYDEDE